MLRNNPKIRQGWRSLSLLGLILLLAPAAALPMHDRSGPGVLREDPALYPPMEEVTLPAQFPEALPAPGAGPEAPTEDALPAADPLPVDGDPATSETAAESSATAPDPRLPEVLAAALAGPLDEFTGRIALRGFYAAHGNLPLWLRQDPFDETARDLLGEIRNSEADGLDPTEYHAWEIESLLRGDAPPTVESRARLELLLSDAFLQLAGHLAGGRHGPALTDPEWFIPAHPANPAALLEQVAAGRPVAEVLAEARPSHPAYGRLKEALAFYSALAATGGWPALEPGDTLELGVRDPRVEVLRQHLQLVGDAPAAPPADPQIFDDALAEAVSRYQERHGLEPDGQVGRKTRAELNVTAVERVDQIKLNLERWRWLPRQLGKRYVLVNVAGFELELLEDDQAKVEMRVIIGQRFTRTPAFTERMTYLELNPYWNVPEKIAREELIPKLATDPEYLDRQNIRILSDWSAEPQVIPAAELNWTPEDGGRFPYRLQQLPGPQNALGHIKFMFPNPYSIYLHDTPARNLFKRTVRTFSHGCIRVEKPLDLADWVLAGSRWTGTRIKELIDQGNHKIITLPKPIPVYVVYLTAWVDEAGQVQLRNDVYGRDRRMTQTLAGLPVTPLSD